MADEPTAETTDGGEFGRAVASCVDSEHAFAVYVRGLVDIDPSTPSRLPGWSIGHVMTHIARNADGVVSMLDGHPQYPHGLEGRNADIESGAGRPWDELVSDAVGSGAKAVEAISSHDDWSGTVQMISGERPATQLPILRQREIEVHRADLGLGYEFADMPADYIRRDLRLLGMLWTARKPMGMASIPDAALAADPSRRLAWLMGRTQIDGLEPAGLF